MTELGFQSIIGYITVSIMLLLISFLFTSNAKPRLPNLLFATYLLLLAIDVSGFFSAGYLMVNFPNVDIFRWTLCLLSPPILYYYFVTVAYIDFRFSVRHILHVLPFLIMNGILLIRIYPEVGTEKVYFFNHHFQMLEMYFFQIIIEIQFIYYITKIFMVLKRYRTIYLENYASTASLVYKWLSQLLAVVFISHLLDVCRNLLRYTKYQNFLIWSDELVTVVALGMICWFLLKALSRPELFRGIDIKLIPAIEIETNLSSASPFRGIEVDNEISAKIVLLENYMTLQEPYLDPMLTIQDLANQLNMPVLELSLLINVYMDQHFFGFIGEYRIRKVMELLKDPTKKHLTILEILYQVGFNSKSSFNISFKKYTSLTPTAYRNS